MSPRITKWIASSVLSAFLALISLTARPALAQVFATIDFPAEGASNTSPGGINNSGQIVGSYTDANEMTHCFLLSAGMYSSIDFPGAPSTVCAGINNSGQIVGSYTDVNNLNHGFLLSNATNGTFTSFDDPSLPNGTFGVQVDDFGHIVGFGYDATGNVHGFLLSKISGGTYTPIDFPDPNTTFTEPLDMNFNGTIIVGAYALSSFPKHTSQGFTDINGAFTSVTYPESISTALNGVSNGGQVAGSYLLSSDECGFGFCHAFLQNGTTFTTEDFPGAVATFAANINDQGQVVGVYVDGNNVFHGYLMTSGPFAYLADAVGVAVLDTSTNVIVTNISLPGAWALAITPDQKHVYVANVGTNSVSIIDTATNTVEKTTIPVGNVPYSIAVAPDGSAVYVTNFDNSQGVVGNTVSVIDTATNQVVATVTVGNGPISVAVTPDSKFAYVSNEVDGSVSVIDTATNTVTTTIQNVTVPWGIAITPNGADVYVANVTDPGMVTVITESNNQIATTVSLGATADATLAGAITPDGASGYFVNDVSNNVSVVNIASNKVVATVPVGMEPFSVASSTDGSLVYVGDIGDNLVSVIQTSNNQVTATIPVVVDGEPLPVTGIAIASAPPTSQTVTQPLSPTQPNVFNFGTNSQAVQYPPGTNFSNVVMKTVAQQITQAQFHKRVAGTQFANATCLVYSGNGGNCIDYRVTCTDTSGNKISCPSEAEPTIAVETDFTTSQAITNPCYLTTPIGKNNWKNIFDSFTADPKVKGKTKGFSEFVACDLGATNPQGLAKFKLLAPTKTETLKTGENLGMSFKLTSVANKTPVTDARANFTATLIADANGNPVSQVVFSAHNVFTQPGTPGVYEYGFCTKRRGILLPVGTYTATIYGDAFASHQFKFKLVARH